MEKVVGDLAYTFLQNAQTPKRVFHNINVFALVIDFGNLKCKPYHLKMDFVDKVSTL